MGRVLVLVLVLVLGLEWGLVGDWGPARGLGEERAEVLDEHHVRNDVYLEGLLDEPRLEVGGLALGVQDPAREERGVDVRPDAVRLLRERLPELVRGALDGPVRRQVEAQEAEARGVDGVADRREDVVVHFGRLRRAVRCVDGEVGRAEEVAREREGYTACCGRDEDEGVWLHAVLLHALTWWFEASLGLSRSVC